MAKKSFLLLLMFVLLLGLSSCGYNIAYTVDDDIREYPVDVQRYLDDIQGYSDYGEMCATYKVTIDIDTFDTSSVQAFNKQIKYLYDEVTSGDGYYRHTVLVYDNITQLDREFTVAMIEDGQVTSSAGWLITPNDDYYDRLFK